MDCIIDISGRQNGRDRYFFLVLRYFLSSYGEFLCKNIFTSLLEHRMIPVPFRLFRKIWATCKNFWANGSQRWQKNARTPMQPYYIKLHYFNKQTKQITKLTCVSYLTLLWKNLLYSRSSDVYRNVKHWLQSLINEFRHDITRDKTV